MAYGDSNINDDDLKELLEQLGDLDELGLDMAGLSEDDLGDMARSVTEDELEELLTDHSLDSDEHNYGAIDFMPKDPGEDDEQPAELGAKAETSAVPEAPEQAGGEFEEPPEIRDELEEKGIEPQTESLGITGDSLVDEMFLSGFDDGAGAAEASAAPVGEEKPGTFDYLKELGGAADESEADDNDMLLDAIVSEAVEDSDELLDEDIPNLGFNESFTKSSDGMTEVVRRGATDPDEQKKPLMSQKSEEPKRKGVLVRFAEILPEPVRVRLEDIRAKSERKRKSRKPLSQQAKMLAAIVVMLIILLPSAFVLYAQYHKMNRLLEESMVIVKTPSYQFNYANYIYSKVVKPFNGRELTLGKLLLDKYMSAFYFNEYLPMDICFAELRDDKGRYYAAYMPLMTPEGKGRLEADMTALWFEGVKQDTEKLFLTIWDSDTKDIAEYEIDIKDYETLPVKYIGNPKGARTSSNDYGLTIEGGTFGSSMSTVIYKIENKGDGDIVHGAAGNSANAGYIGIENTGTIAAPLLSQPLIYEVDDNITIARMDFSPVRNINNSALLTFKDLYSFYELSHTIEGPLLFDAPGDGVRIEFAGGTLVLEGMRQYSDRFVLVYHFEHMSGERFEGLVDAELVIRTYSGLEVRLEPFVRSKEEGGDILFEYESPNSIIDNSGPENVFVEIKSARINLSDAVSEIHLPSEAENPEGASYAEIKEFVESAYMRRLADKSGVTGGAPLSDYFDADVLSNTRLNRLYNPILVTSAPEYTATVRLAARLSRSEYFVVVDESWLGISGEERTHYYQTHKVIVKQIEDKFVITSDDPQ